MPLTKKELKELKKLLCNWEAAKRSAEVDMNQETPGCPESSALFSEVQTYEVCIEALGKVVSAFHITDQKGRS